jgi:hypothetical protein|tara:strand:- start:43 stop:225 length:183 start_codon:yes stop_codon:yes gene_type:complete
MKKVIDSDSDRDHVGPRVVYVLDERHIKLAKMERVPFRSAQEVIDSAEYVPRRVGKVTGL